MLLGAKILKEEPCSPHVSVLVALPDWAAIQFSVFAQVPSKRYSLLVIKAFAKEGKTGAPRELLCGPWGHAGGDSDTLGWTDAICPSLPPMPPAGPQPHTVLKSCNL